ncbi:MAG: glycosyltransferase [Actinomycetes bacterium]
MEYESAKLAVAVAANSGKSSSRLGLWLVKGKRRVVPSGSLLDQALGYARVTAAMGLNYLLGEHSGDGDGRATRTGAPGSTHVVQAREADGVTAAAGASAGVDEPLFSVIMPVFNAQRSRPDYLRSALDSIAAQTYRGFELIIVDDGSTDDTIAVVQSWLQSHDDLDVTVLRKENGGQSSARNLAASHARGAWLTFLDQDDLWVPKRLESAQPLLTSDVDLVYSDADTIDADGHLEHARIHVTLRAGGRHPKTTAEDALYRDVYVMPGVMAMRRELFARLNGFDEDLSGYEDDDLFLRALSTARVAYYPLPTLKWRTYDHNYSRSGRMVASRSNYWRKLMRDYADGGRASRRARLITLRFLREFLTQCILLQDEDPALAAQNFEAALELVPHLGVVDRCAFAATEWAWTRPDDRAAYLARWWFVNGLQRSS